MIEQKTNGTNEIEIMYITFSFNHTLVPKSVAMTVSSPRKWWVQMQISKGKYLKKFINSCSKGGAMFVEWSPRTHEKFSENQ